MKLASAVRHADLYPDRHLNVFVPYQSHDLDYNVTRAMISTLRWSRVELTQAFLRDVAGTDVGSTNGFHYDLQSCDYEDFDPAEVKTKVLLGVSVSGELATNLPPMDDPDLSAGLLGLLRAPIAHDHKLAEVRRVLARPELTEDELAVLHHSLEELADGCMPDGWVFSPDADVCVLIEAKLLNLLDLYQLQRYGDLYFGREYAADEIKLVTWEQVSAFFAGHRGDDDARTAFLCSQLCDYFDVLGLSTFSGFKPYDFDADSAQEALPKFRRFAQRLHDKADEAGLGLAAVTPSPTGARVAFSDPRIPGERALDLLEAGIRVELRCGDAAAGRLAGRAGVDAILDANMTDDVIANPLEGADLPGLRVRIERLRSDSSDGEAYVELETLASDLLPDEFDFVIEELRRHHPTVDNARTAAGTYRRAALSIGALVPRADVLGEGDAGMNATLAVLKVVVATARKLAITADEDEPAEAEA